MIDAKRLEEIYIIVTIIITKETRKVIEITFPKKQKHITQIWISKSKSKLNGCMEEGQILEWKSKKMTMYDDTAKKDYL